MFKRNPCYFFSICDSKEKRKMYSCILEKTNALYGEGCYCYDDYI